MTWKKTKPNRIYVHRMSLSKISWDKFTFAYRCVSLLQTTLQLSAYTKHNDTRYATPNAKHFSGIIFYDKTVSENKWCKEEKTKITSTWAADNSWLERSQWVYCVHFINSLGKSYTLTHVEIWSRTLDKNYLFIFLFFFSFSFFLQTLSNANPIDIKTVLWKLSNSSLYFCNLLFCCQHYCLPNCKCTIETIRSFFLA